MKIVLFSAFALIGVFSAAASHAQDTNYNFPGGNESLTANVPLNEISARAYRNFVKCYGFISGSVWQKRQQGYIVRFFSSDSVLNIVRYSLRGNPGVAYTYYTAKNAPPDICAWMKTMYAEYSILYVNELKSGNSTTFEIGLLDDDKFRVIEEKNGEISSTLFISGYANANH
jgi:hypothetical protein